ncbi:hypothetical protein [Chryseosolibacter indicus]|uniref:Uncharacterized protein n=1 Tax=Chryseosolibacter indicus TaxID=2782351 RepID=A0ABS5VW45_9BACT|nr:hypothetical protein [Chryseosolibacter indicus]MBT1705647.1 hypothetical protein [Chryseosolibacter indicus]
METTKEPQITSASPLLNSIRNTSKSLVLSEKQLSRCYDSLKSDQQILLESNKLLHESRVVLQKALPKQSSL